MSVELKETKKSSSSARNEHEYNKEKNFGLSMENREKDEGEVDNVTLFLNRLGDKSPLKAENFGLIYKTYYPFKTLSEVAMFLDIETESRLDEVRKFDLETFSTDTVCRAVNRIETYALDSTDNSAKIIYNHLVLDLPDDYAKYTNTLARIYRYLVSSAVTQYERDVMDKYERLLAFCKGRHAYLRHSVGGKLKIATPYENNFAQGFKRYRTILQEKDKESVHQDYEEAYKASLKDETVEIGTINIASALKSPVKTGDSAVENDSYSNKYSKFRTNVKSNTPMILITSKGAIMKAPTNSDVVLTHEEIGDNGMKRLSNIEFNDKSFVLVQTFKKEIVQLSSGTIRFGLPKKDTKTFKGLENLLHDLDKVKVKPKPALKRTTSFKLKFNLEDEEKKDEDSEEEEEPSEAKPEKSEAKVTLEKNSLIVNFDAKPLTMSFSQLESLKPKREKSCITLMNQSGKKRLEYTEMASLGYYLQENKGKEYQLLLDSLLKDSNPLRNLEEIYNKSYKPKFKALNENVKFYIVMFLSNRKVAKEFVYSKRPIISLRNDDLIIDLPSKDQNRIRRTSQSLFEDCGMLSEYQVLPKRRGRSGSRSRRGGKQVYDRGGNKFYKE